MRENVLTFVLRDDEQDDARGIAERYLQLNPTAETKVGERVYLGTGGVMEYVLRLLSVAPNPTNPTVTTYTWEVSGMGKVSNIAKMKAANGGDPVIKLNG